MGGTANAGPLSNANPKYLINQPQVHRRSIRSESLTETKHAAAVAACPPTAEKS